MDAVAVSVLGSRRDLGEDLVAAPPRGADRLELRAVVEAHVGQPVVQRLDGELLRTRGRPLQLRHVVVPGRQRAGGVTHPGGFVVGPREDADLAPLTPSPTTTCSSSEPCSGRRSGASSVRFSTTGQSTRSPAASASSTRPVPGSSTVPNTLWSAIQGCVASDSRLGERPAVLARELQPCAEQRMVQPVVGGGVSGEPEVLVLERVGRELDGPRARVQRVPVRSEPGELSVGEQGSERLGLGTLGAQRRRDRRSVIERASAVSVLPGPTSI